MTGPSTYFSNLNLNITPHYQSRNTENIATYQYRTDTFKKSLYFMDHY